MEDNIRMKKLAIYIHIPFCKQKCKYCDFNSFPGSLEVTIENYINALINQIGHYSEKTKDYKVTSVYFGGGTPSFIDEKCIRRILNNIKEKYSISDDAEITIEANPGTVNKAKLEEYISLGFNRLSFGVQSLNDDILKNIGRCHTASDAVENYKLARLVGFKNISLDLMFGLPNQSLQDVEKTLNKFIELNPEHISTYSLKVEEDTVFGRLEKEGKLVLPSEMEERNMYYLIKNKLKENGYNQYEISNFSKVGYESRHNMAYWERIDYIGFGISASSCFLEKRFTNTDKIEEYIKNPINNFIEEEVLTKEVIESERVILGLRLLKGIDEALIVKKEWKESVDKLKKEELIIKENKKLKLTDKGLDLANQVFVEFI